MRERVLLTLLVALAPASSALAAKPTTVSGTVREVAGGPAGQSAVELKTDDGRTLSLRGRTPPEEDELRRLSGVKVRIEGMVDENVAGIVQVERYEILDIGGGVIPRLGMLAAIDLEGQRRLIFVDEQGNADLLPTGWTAKMAKNVGAKMWMVGARKGKSFQPTRHAILRPSPKAPAAQEPEKKPAE